MFERLAKALTPFGAVMVIISGLTLANRMQVSDRVMIGYVTTFIGVSMAIVYVVAEIKNSAPKQTKRKD